MSSVKKIFDEYVINGIKAGNSFGIEKVKDLESIKSMYFNQDAYELVKKMILEGDIDKIKQMSPPESIEFLEVMFFSDQSNQKYIVTVYDNDNMWQDPQIIDIFLFLKT